MSDIDSTLAERGSRYGDFPDHAAITQDIKSAMQGHGGWENLVDDQKEALEMVAHKIGRIINGDPNYIDSWTDIIGYVRLVEKRLIDEQAVQHKFAFDPEPAAKKSSIGEKLAGINNSQFDSLEKALRDIFGPDVEVTQINI